jgi:hypothetical protein
MKMFITEQQAQALLNARKLSTQARKAEKKRIIAEVKRQHGIPSVTKLVFFIENPENPLYRVIRDKRSKQPLDNGVPDAVKPVVKAKSPVTAKAPAKKAAPVKVVAKAPAKVAAKAETKKAPAKVAAKKSVPAKATQKPLGSPVRTAQHTVEVRTTLEGVRVRLGYAKNEAEKQKMIALRKST